MDQETISTMERRVKRLERLVRVFLVACASGAIVLAASALAVLSAANRSGPPPKVLRVRGLIIEDEHGRERVLVGAPVPNAGRKRQDAATGLIVLGENGADRVSLGYTPDPQIRGEVSRRIAPATGITVHDPDGNERGGFGYLDVGQNVGKVVLGLDRPTSEALLAVVDDQTGLAAFLVHNEQRKDVAALGTNDGLTLLKLADTRGTERVLLRVNKDGTPLLEVLDEEGKRLCDVFERVQK